MLHMINKMNLFDQLKYRSAWELYLFAQRFLISRDLSTGIFLKMYFIDFLHLTLIQFLTFDLLSFYERKIFKIFRILKILSEN